MNEQSAENLEHGHGSLIRLGGLAMLVSMGIHIALNGFVKEFPPESPSLVELQTYLANEAGTWAVVHGLRYVAFVCLVLFAAGLFARTCCTRGVRPIGWGVVGLLGTAAWVTNGVVTNGAEIVAFMNLELVSKQQDLFWLLYHLTRVLFTAEVVTWSIAILGFSYAGWCSMTLPKWLVFLGGFNVIAGLLSGVFVVSIMNEGPAAVAIDVASLTGLAWFLCAGVVMLLRGES